eukprot:769738-Prorocentrum_minimum.AAC.8
MGGMGVVAGTVPGSGAQTKALSLQYRCPCPLPVSQHARHAVLKYEEALSQNSRQTRGGTGGPGGLRRAQALR